MNKFFVLLLISVSQFCLGQNDPVSAAFKKYNDLKDYGYKDRVKTVTLEIFNTPVGHMDNWQVGDSSGMHTTIIYLFDKEGNFQKREVKYGASMEVFEYQYSNGAKCGWKKKDSTGNLVATAEIRSFADSGFIELEHDLKKNAYFETKYYLGKDLKTYKMTVKWTDEGGKIIYSSVTEYKDGPGGYLHLFSVKDLLKNTSEENEFVILSKDSRENPLKILLKINGQPKELRYFKFTYY